MVIRRLLCIDACRLSFDPIAPAVTELDHDGQLPNSAPDRITHSSLFPLFSVVEAQRAGGACSEALLFCPFSISLASSIPAPSS